MSASHMERRARWVRATRRYGVLCVALCALVITPHSRARAFFADSAILTQILGQDIATYIQVVRTMQDTARQVQQLNDMLARVRDGGSMGSLVAVGQRSMRMGQAIDKDIRFIGHKLELVDREHKEVYQESLRGTDPSKFQDKYRAWNGALLESSRVAVRAQTNIADLEARAQAQAALVADSEGTKGVVGQLQLVVRSLALMHTDLAAIQRTLDTGMRVTANMAAGQASENNLIDEQTRLSLENYTWRGPPVAVPNELP